MHVISPDCPPSGIPDAPIAKHTPVHHLQTPFQFPLPAVPKQCGLFKLTDSHTTWDDKHTVSLDHSPSGIPDELLAQHIPVCRLQTPSQFTLPAVPKHHKLFEFTDLYLPQEHCEEMNVMSLDHSLSQNPNAQHSLTHRPQMPSQAQSTVPEQHGLFDSSALDPLSLQVSGYDLLQAHWPENLLHA